MLLTEATMYFEEIYWRLTLAIIVLHHEARLLAAHLSRTSNLTGIL